MNISIVYFFLADFVVFVKRIGKNWDFFSSLTNLTLNPPHHGSLSMQTSLYIPSPSLNPLLQVIYMEVEP
jgi:hypothetical protein